MSWSPDNAYIHVRTVEDRSALHDYIVSLEDREVSLAFGEPAWGSAYWARKSDLAAPGVTSLRMEITESNRRTRPAPFGGGFANGGAQTPDVKNPVDAYESEITLRLLGVEIGNWINGAPMAGETFGWGPDGSAALVFVDRTGRLVFQRQPDSLAGVRPWNLAVDQSALPGMLTISSATSGTGNTTMGFRVAGFTGGSRTGTIRVSGGGVSAVYTVIQQ